MNLNGLMWLVATILDSAGMDCACVMLEWATSLYLKVIQPKLLSSLIQKKVSKKKKNTNSEMYERQKLKAFQL